MSAPFPLPAANPRHGTLLMLASAGCFVANALVIRLLGARYAVDSWLLSSVRFVVGLALIVALFPPGRVFKFSNLFRNPQLIVRGVIGGIGVYLYYVTIVHLGVGRATFISNTYVVMGALLAVALLKEPLTIALVTGSVVSLFGLALLTNVIAASRAVGFYDFLAVLGALASAVVIVTIRQLHRTEHTATIFGAQCLYGLLFCLVPAVARFSLPPAAAWALLVASALCAGAGQLTMTRAYRELTVARGALLQMLVPLGIAAGGVLLFGEHFQPNELVGAALILAGTLLTMLRR
ncbi:MAG TPA: DMT family transporter [Opitutaceae bacterium]|nr:DMT family transporter [Opitutaceae bacterium]